MKKKALVVTIFITLFIVIIGFVYSGNDSNNKKSKQSNIKKSITLNNQNTKKTPSPLKQNINSNVKVARPTNLNKNKIDQQYNPKINECSTRNICEPCCKVCEPCEPCKPCCQEKPKTGQPCQCAYNAPARIDPACGYRMWIDASFIYWQVKERGFEIGEHFNATVSPQIRDTINLDFDFHPGFKIGIGKSFCRDDWTLYLDYTRIKSKDSTSKDLDNNVIINNNYLITTWFSTFWNFTPQFSSLKGKLEINYNIFDLELGRPFYVGKKVVFKPIFSVRSGWIDQKYQMNAIHVTSLGSFPNFFTSKQNSWLIGPRVGLFSDWLIGCHFKIFANASASLVYQKFKTNINLQHPIENTTPANEIVLRDRISLLNPNIALQLGIGYGRYFCNNQWHFDLNVGYDFDYFWNQNLLINLTQVLDNISIKSDLGALMLQGLEVQLRLDF